MLKAHQRPRWLSIAFQHTIEINRVVIVIKLNDSSNKMSSGRFRGHRGAGRGRGGRKPQNNPGREAKKKKTIDDYFFYVGSSKQVSDFKTTSEFLINHVKKTLIEETTYQNRYEL